MNHRSDGDMGEEGSHKTSGREHALGARLDVAAQEAASGRDVCADSCMTTESRQRPRRKELQEEAMAHRGA